MIVLISVLISPLIRLYVAPRSKRSFKGSSLSLEPHQPLLHCVKTDRGKISAALTTCLCITITVVHEEKIQSHLDIAPDILFNLTQRPTMLAAYMKKTGI